MAMARLGLPHVGVNGAEWEVACFCLCKDNHQGRLPRLLDSTCASPVSQRALKSVLLPTLGKPTMPRHKKGFATPQRKLSACLFEVLDTATWKLGLKAERSTWRSLEIQSSQFCGRGSTKSSCTPSPYPLYPYVFGGFGGGGGDPSKAGSAETVLRKRTDISRSMRQPDSSLACTRRGKLPTSIGRNC